MTTKLYPAEEVMDPGAVPKEIGMLSQSMKSIQYVVAVIVTTVPAHGSKNAPSTICHCLHCQRFKVFVNKEPFRKQMTFVKASQKEGCVHFWRSKTVAQKALDVNLIGKWFGRVRIMGLNVLQIQSAVACV